MFSREKLEKILQDNEHVLTNRSNFFKVVMSNQQTENVNNFHKEFKGGGGKQKTVKTFLANNEELEDVDDVEVLPHDRYSNNNDNSDISTRTLTLRNSTTPVENVFMSDYKAVKPNKQYPAEQIASGESDDEVKNSVEDTFHMAVRPILFLGQCFALMPVMGILDSNPKRVRFSYKSLQVIVTLAFMCASSIFTLTMLKFLIKIGINAKNFVGLVFFGCVQCCCILFASLAPRWPKIIRYWSKVESTFTQKPYEMPKKGLARRVRVSALFIIVGMAVEHALYLSSAIITYKRSVELCATIRNYTEKVSFEDYIIRNYNYLFEILPYNMFVGVFLLIINGSCTFIWNYMDLFIMMVSKAIAYRFEQITARINKLSDKEIPETVFIDIREHYVKLCELLEFIDDNLSGIILLSCINNLYFVCYQLLNIFNKLRWPINYIYFWYSLLYLIGRTAFVFLSAASINDESKGGLPVLRRVSSRTWCVEVERLIFEMTTQTVALSGKKFYFLTRRLLFGMAGTIVTYELVLLQFDEPNRVKGLAALCA